MCFGTIRCQSGLTVLESVIIYLLLLFMSTARLVNDNRSRYPFILDLSSTGEDCLYKSSTTCLSKCCALEFVELIDTNTCGDNRGRGASKSLMEGCKTRLRLQSSDRVMLKIFLPEKTSIATFGSCHVQLTLTDRDTEIFETSAWTLIGNNFILSVLTG